MPPQRSPPPPLAHQDVITLHDRDRSRGSVNPRGFCGGGVSMVRGRGVRGRDNSLRSRSCWDWSNKRAQGLISLASAFSNVSGILSQARHITRDMSPSYDDTRHFQVPAYTKKKSDNGKTDVTR